MRAAGSVLQVPACLCINSVCASLLYFFLCYFCGLIVHVSRWPDERCNTAAREDDVQGVLWRVSMVRALVPLPRLFWFANSTHLQRTSVCCSSSSLGGSIILLLGYGYLLLKGAQLLSDGSEMLLEVLDPGIIGACSKPRLGIVNQDLACDFAAQACVHARRLGMQPSITGNFADGGCAFQVACFFLCWEPCQTASS